MCAISLASNACSPIAFSQCSQCAYPDSLPELGLPAYRTLQEHMCIDKRAMSFEDDAALILVGAVVVLTLVNEIHTIRLLELVIGAKGKVVEVGKQAIDQAVWEGILEAQRTGHVVGARCDAVPE